MATKTKKPSASNRVKKPRIKRLPKGLHGGVELLLIQSVEHLGSQGDVVEVKRGLCPQLLDSSRFGDHCY